MDYEGITIEDIIKDPSAVKEVDLRDELRLKCIQSACFQGWKNMTTLRLPRSIRSIAEYSFAYCSALEDADFRDLFQLTKIEQGCFRLCESLTTVRMPYSMESLGQDSFAYCSSLSVLNLQNLTNLTDIEAHCFEYCTSLTTVRLPTSILSIGGSAFDHCSSLTYINLENLQWLFGIEYNCFRNCKKLESIRLPESVQSIGTCAFSGCDALEYVDLLNCRQLVQIEDAAFENCPKLFSISFPAAMVERQIAGDAFDVSTIFEEVVTDRAGRTSDYFPSRILIQGSPITSLIVEFANGERTGYVMRPDGRSLSLYNKAIPAEGDDWHRLDTGDYIVGLTGTNLEPEDYHADTPYICGDITFLLNSGKTISSSRLSREVDDWRVGTEFEWVQRDPRSLLKDLVFVAGKFQRLKSIRSMEHLIPTAETFLHLKKKGRVAPVLAQRVGHVVHSLCQEGGPQLPEQIVWIIVWSLIGLEIANPWDRCLSSEKKSVQWSWD